MLSDRVYVFAVTNKHNDDIKMLDFEINPNSNFPSHVPNELNTEYRKAWIGYRDGIPTSYIAVEYDKALSPYLGEGVALITDFCSRDDVDTVSAVVKKASNWLQQQGAFTLRGPMTHSVSKLRGILVEGYTLPPCLGLAYNPPYYDHLLNNAGFRKTMDMFSYYVRTETLEKVMRVARIAKLRNPGLKIRSLNLAQKDRELHSIVELYNSAWCGHWSFIPVTKEDFSSALDSMEMFFDPEMVKIATIGNRDIGVMVSVPNILDGEVRETGVPVSARAMLFGIDCAYQKRGIDALLMQSAVEMAKQKQIRTYEIGWVLESNTIWRNQLENTCESSIIGRRRYRIYEQSFK